MPRKKPRYDHTTRTLRKLRAVVAAHRTWLAEGLPHRAITVADVAGRIALFEETEALIRTHELSGGPRIQQAATLRALRAKVTDDRKWLAAGLPARTPITKAEVQRRIDLMEAAEALIRGTT